MQTPMQDLLVEGERVLDVGKAADLAPMRQAQKHRVRK
jgi:hypothetical protein